MLSRFYLPFVFVFLLFLFFCFVFFFVFVFLVWGGGGLEYGHLRAQDNLTLLHANNKCTDQPAHLRSLISAFVIHSPENIIALFDKCQISIF